MQLLFVLYIFILSLFLIILKKLKYSNIFLNIFLVIWTLVFLIFVIANNTGKEYLTLKGVVIIFSHITVVCIGVLSSLFKRKRIKLKITIPKIKIRIQILFYILFILTSIGLVLLTLSVNLFEVLRSEELAKMRGEALSKQIEISSYVILLTNFIYPLTVIAPLYTLCHKKNPVLFFIVFLMGMYFSLSTGGKGGVVTLSILLIASIYFLVSYQMIQLSKIQVRNYLFIFGTIIIGFIAFITSTRVGKSSSTELIDENYNMFISYFTNPIPAFCQLLEQKEWYILNFDLRDHSIIRNLSGFFGEKLEWSMDKNVVYIPNFHNVFTSLADSIYSLGLFLSLIYYLLIGKIFFWLNLKSEKNINKIFIFSIFFLFSFYSFYVDIFFFMSGAWYCILFYFFIDIKQENI